MTSHAKHHQLLLLLAPLALLAGCGGNDGPPVYETTGLVSYGGEPVAGCVVAFAPSERGGELLGARGTTGEDGRFLLYTSDPLGKDHRQGAMAGSFMVTISKWERSSTGEQNPPKNLLPGKYNQSRTSGLTAVVTPEGPNEFVYDLTD